MELFDTLSEIGLTPRILQLMIVLGIIAFLLGTFWKIFVIGAGVMFCVAVFAMGPQKSTKAVGADMVPAEFIEDCMRYNENPTKEGCIKLWKEDGNGKE